jgi:hypothetical protein
MLKVQKHSMEEEFVNKAKADAKLEIYSEVVGTTLGMWDAKA